MKRDYNSYDFKDNMIYDDDSGALIALCKRINLKCTKRASQSGTDKRKGGKKW